jgi:DNA-binding NtrC family response regulator
MLRGNLLVIDDEEAIRNVIRRLFRGTEIEVFSAGTGEDGLNMLKEFPIDVLLTDLRLPGINGIEVLRQAKKMDENLEVIVMTAYGTVDTAVDAMKLGAMDFLTKPFDSLEKVKRGVELALERRDLRRKNIELERELSKKYGLENIVGKSKKMEELFNIIKSIAETNATVLIEGESGTGKELVARTIHFLSKRKGGPFIPVDCSTLPKELIESELFGHVKGSFTGAHESTKGLFRIADEGTIFLDEIGDLPLEVQGKLLRVLEERQVRPVGSSETFPVSVRVIAATNVDLKRAVEEKKFREDLFYRLNVLPVKLPPLRERKEDIPLLLDFFIKQIKRDAGIDRDVSFSPEAIDALINYPWHGNVRELKNVIERTILLTRSSIITLNELPGEISRSSHSPADINIQEIPLTFASYEKACIERALMVNKNNIEATARQLGIAVSSLYRKMKQHSIKIK